MSDFFPSHFYLNVSILLILLAGIIAGAASYYLYRRTIPPLAIAWQIFLAVARGAAVTMVLLLLLAPRLTIVWQKNIPKKVVVAIDRSASMGLLENGRSRIERAVEIGNRIKQRIGESVSLNVYAFDIDSIGMSLNDIDTTRQGTDIERSLRHIIDGVEDAETIILISDGSFTVGENPLYSNSLAKTKMVAIGIGDTLNAPDLIVTEVKSNRIVYQKKPTRIIANIMVRGMNSVSTNIKLKKDGKVQAVKRVSFNKEGTLTPVEFEIIPEKTGMVVYEIEIDPVRNEQVLQNNRYLTSMEVLKGQLDVGFISAKPDFEGKFLNYLLQDNKEISLRRFIPKRGSESFLDPLGSVLDSLDIMILYNPFDLQPEIFRRLFSFLDRTNLPLLLITNSRIRSEYAQIAKRYMGLGITASSAREKETQVSVTVEGILAPFLKVFENDELNSRFWTKCPPVFQNYNKIELQEGVRVLLESSVAQDPLPVLLLWSGSGRKSLSLLGSGFWRWHFQLVEDSDFQDGWRKIFANMIRWLGSGDAGENVILSLNKKEYQSGQIVPLNTQVYDASFKPVEDGIVRIEVSGPAGKFEMDTDYIGQGIYSARHLPLLQGRYRFRATAWRNDVQLGVSQKEILVTPVNSEFQDTRQDRGMLKQLAAKMGGIYFDENETEKIFDQLDLRQKSEFARNNFELWQMLPVLLVLLGLFTLEWFVRKRKGLP